MSELPKWWPFKEPYMIGDCLPYLEAIPDKAVDLVLTDPPYGINIANNPFRQKFEKRDWDKNPCSDETIKETAAFIRNAKWVTAFGIHQFVPFPGCAVWENPDQFNYSIEKDIEFNTYHTIGKKDFIPNVIPKEVKRFKYLKKVAGNRNIEQKGN